MEAHDRINELLAAARHGDRSALDQVFDSVYGELRRLARSQRRRWQGDTTLSTTALVHEAYVKLVDQNHAQWNDRAHFLAVASKAMRHVLVNYAEQRLAQKRGGGAPHVPLDEANPVTEEAADEVLALHEALDRLAQVNRRQVQVVESRFFAGLSIEQTAEVLGISPATVKRDWQTAGAWLHREIQLTMD
jgi:RNA polymerase sigma factor (TIGR02999 family)